MFHAAPRAAALSFAVVAFPAADAYAHEVPPLTATSLFATAATVNGALVRGLGDIDLDTHPDYLIADPANNKLVVYTGASGAVLYGFTPPPGETGVAFGGNVAVLAELGSSGAVDVLVADLYASIPTVRRYRVAGSGATHTGTLTGATAGRFGFAMCWLGDVDADLAPDFAIADPSAQNGAGEVRCYSGSTMTQVDLLVGAPGESFGWSLSDAIWDLSGDGVPDFVVGAPALGIAAPGSAYVCSAATFDPQFSVSQGLAGDGFGAQVVNLGRPFFMPPTYVAKFAVSAPFHAGARGAVYQFTGATLEYTHVGEVAGKEFGRQLANAFDTRFGSSHELGIGDLDTYFVRSAFNGLEYYRNPLPDELISFHPVADWNPAHDNYCDMAVLYRVGSTLRLDVFSGKTLYESTKTLTASAELQGPTLLIHVNGNPGATHYTRPFLLLAGRLSDPNFTGSSESIYGSGFYLPIDFSLPISSIFFALPPFLIPMSGQVDYFLPLDASLAPLAAIYATATDLVFCGVLQTGTTLAATNPVAVAPLLGG
jgi:hypothetical protein